MRRGGAKARGPGADGDRQPPFPKMEAAQKWEGTELTGEEGTDTHVLFYFCSLGLTVSVTSRNSPFLGPIQVWQSSPLLCSQCQKF